MVILISRDVSDEVGEKNCCDAEVSFMYCITHSEV